MTLSARWRANPDAGFIHLYVRKFLMMDGLVLVMWFLAVFMLALGSARNGLNQAWTSIPFLCASLMQNASGSYPGDLPIFPEIQWLKGSYLEWYTASAFGRTWKMMALSLYSAALLMIFRSSAF